jgi:hypothetical protein
MGRVAQLGVYAEILGTFGIAIVLAIHGFHHTRTDAARPAGGTW